MKVNKIEKIEINKLFLDQKNPRYSTYDDKLKENMIHFMLEVSGENKILELLKDIINMDGFNPLARIGVVFEQQKNIVIDGNRRIACLKILLANDNDWQKLQNTKFKTFLEENKERILSFQKNFFNLYKNEVEVVIFKTREEANAWVERLHTQVGGHTTEAWETFERYLHQKDLVTLFVFKKMKEYRIERRIFVEIVEHSIWKRIFAFNVFKTYFTIKKINDEYFVDDKDFQIKINAMINLLESKVIRYNTSFITVDQAKKTIETIDNEVKKLGINSYSNIDSSIKQEQLITAENAIKANPKKNAKIKQNKQKKIVVNKEKHFFTSIISQIDNYKLANLLEQIEKIKFKDYLELVSCALRPIVEISTDTFLDKKLHKSKTWFDDNGQLQTRIIEVINNLNNISKENKSTIKQIENDVKAFLHIMNGDLHDVSLSSTTKELEKNLQRIKPYVEEIWKQIKTN